MATSQHEAVAEHAEGHGGHGVGRYFLVLVILLALTAVTVWTGKMHLGRAAIFIAMLIACTKATLVILFFMHMLEAANVNRIVLVVSFLFVGVLIAGVFGDLMTRLEITLPHGGPVTTPVPARVAPPGH